MVWGYINAYGNCSSCLWKGIIMTETDFIYWAKYAVIQTTSFLRRSEKDNAKNNILQLSKQLLLRKRVQVLKCPAGSTDFSPAESIISWKNKKQWQRPPRTTISAIFTIGLVCYHIKRSNCCYCCLVWVSHNDFIILLWTFMLSNKV